MATGYIAYGTKKENENTGTLFALSLDEAGNELRGKDVAVTGMKRVRVFEVMSLKTGNNLLVGMASTGTTIYEPSDGMILGVNPEGRIVRKNILPSITRGIDDSSFFSIFPVADDEFIVAGNSSTNRFNASGNYGEYDIWV